MIRLSATLFAVVVCTLATSQTSDQPLARAFVAAPGQTFYLDLDAAPGVFSQWRHEDVEALSGLQTVLRVPRIRKDPKWAPTFTIYLQNKDHQSIANDLGLQVVAPDKKPPMRLRLVGHVDGRLIQEIPLQTVVNLNEELRVEIAWVTQQSITFKVGSAETQAVKITWPVGSIVITGSTGQLKLDPLLFSVVNH